MFDQEEFRNQICARYTASEIVEVLDLTSEELFDILNDEIMDNITLFELVIMGRNADVFKKRE